MLTLLCWTLSYDTVLNAEFTKHRGKWSWSLLKQQIYLIKLKLEINEPMSNLNP